MVKLAEIAAASGFSIPVVSRVLNPKPDRAVKIAPATRELILATARKMNYRPNRNAEFLKRGRDPVIGVFLPGFRNSLVTDLVMGISDAARNHGFPVSFFFRTDFAGYRDFILETSGRRNCGLVTYPYFQVDRATVELIEAYCANGGKMVMLNADRSLYKVPHIGINDFSGGKIAAEHLLAHGCESFLLVKGCSARCRGFSETVRRAGAELHAGAEDPDYYRFIVEHCRKSSGKIGIFTCADRMAAALHGLLLRAGLPLGGRIRLVGYDDLFLAQYLSPALTTVSQPFAEAGTMAIDKLVDLIYARPVESVLLEPRLIVRETA